MVGTKTKPGISYSSRTRLPPEFEWCDKPFGVEQHHVAAIGLLTGHFHLFYYLFYLLPYGHVPKASVLLGLAYGYWTGIGITVGAHRLWSHRSFKANKALQIFLMLAQTAALQNPLFKWCRDHRLHHKYSDTEADPHNASRGFWFSHITWTIQSRNKLVQEKLKHVDVSDFVNDPIVRFQSKYYFPLVFLVHLVVPMTLCHIFFPEMSLWQIYAWNDARWCYVLHVAFLVNSVAHLWGNKPYDKYIRPTENKMVSIFALGEGWHNYHHTFPWDYKTAEFGYRYNFSTFIINVFAWLGWAYDLKTVSHQLLVDRINRTGDERHPLYRKHKDREDKIVEETFAEQCWGWGDEQINKSDLEVTEILYPLKHE